MKCVKNNLAWNFISLYYSRNYWPNLLEKIDCFKNENSSCVINFLISFSEHKGDNIRLSISSDISDFQFIRKRAIAYFSTFFLKNPSLTERAQPFGKTFWKNFENNCIIFDAFKLRHFHKRDLDLIKQTNKIIIKLSNQDYSQDSLMSIALYLLIILLRLFLVEEHVQLALRSIRMRSMQDFGSYGLNDKISELINELEIDKKELEQTLNSYLEDHISDETAIWSTNIYNFESDKVVENFQHIADQLLETLGQNYYHKALLFTILLSWVENRQGSPITSYA
jgi:hypothetical protein